MVWWLYAIDERVNHRLPRWAFQRWFCDWVDYLIVRGTR